MSTSKKRGAVMLALVTGTLLMAYLTHHIYGHYYEIVRTQVIQIIENDTYRPVVNIKRVRIINKEIISVFLFNESHLTHELDAHCKDDFLVPNIVHFVWLGRNPLKFYQLVSMLGASKSLQPCRILIHGDNLPYGKWWDYLIERVDNIIHVYRQQPTRIFGNPVNNIQHRSDVVRMQALKKYGGIYLDCDYVALRSFDNLRNYEMTLGMESHESFCNAIIISKNDSEFLQVWYDTYVDFNDAEWATQSSFKPFKIWKKAHLGLHVEETSLLRPSYMEVNLIYDSSIDLRTKYGIHLWHRWHNKEHNTEDILSMKTTFGAVCRDVTAIQLTSTIMNNQKSGQETYARFVEVCFKNKIDCQEFLKSTCSCQARKGLVCMML